MNMHTLIAIALLTLTGPALAQDAPPPAAGGQGKGAEWCKANPEKCKQLREQMREKCAADPVACEQKKAQIKERIREKCQADPEACKEKAGQMRQHRSGGGTGATP